MSVAVIITTMNTSTTRISAQVLTSLSDIMELELPPHKPRPNPIEAEPTETWLAVYEDDRFISAFGSAPPASSAE
jgi:hypothetical protein